MESLSNTFPNTTFVITTYLKVGCLETKDNYIRNGGVERKG